MADADGRSAAPYRLGPDDPALPQVLDLIRTAFAYMDGVIDPPSSMHRLTVEALQDNARRGEVWAIGTPPVACVILTPLAHALYLGKLAVASRHRGQGLARRLANLAQERARALGLQAVELQTRVELVANQAAFVALGFVETGRTAHSGYDRPTSITYRKAVAT